MKVIYVLALALIALVIAACGSTPAYNTPTPEGYQASPTSVPTQGVAAADQTVQPGAATPAATEVPPGGVEVALAHVKKVDGVLATVNGKDITWQQFEPDLTYNLHAVTQYYGVDWNQVENQQLIPQFQDSVLQQTITNTLLRQLAAGEGVTVTDAELQTAIDTQKASILSSGSYADWAGFQAQMGITDEYFAQLMRDSELQKRLAETHGPARSVEQVHAAHILVADEATALKVIERLNAGEDFGALAKELSTDTGSAADGGDLGWFPKGQMVPEFETAAFALEAGQISQPVKSDYGYHIIKVLEKGMHDLDETTYTQMAQEALLTWLQEQAKTAKIDVKVKFQE